VLGGVGEGDGLGGGDAAGGPGDGGGVEQIVLGRAGDFGRQGEAGLREQFPADDQAGLGVLAGGERRAR